MSLAKARRVVESLSMEFGTLDSREGTGTDYASNSVQVEPILGRRVELDEVWCGDKAFPQV